MKKNLLILISAFMVLTAVSACKKNCCTIPNNQISAPYNFMLIDKNGNGLVHSLADSVKFSYKDQGVTKYLNLQIRKLYVSATDTTQAKKYNGFVISERNNELLEAYNANASRYTFYLNGTAVGEFYQRIQDGRFFVFNDRDANRDDSADYYATGSKIYLLRVN